MRGILWLLSNFRESTCISLIYKHELKRAVYSLQVILRRKTCITVTEAKIQFCIYSETFERVRDSVLVRSLKIFLHRRALRFASLGYKLN